MLQSLEDEKKNVKCSFCFSNLTNTKIEIKIDKLKGSKHNFQILNCMVTIKYIRL